MTQSNHTPTPWKIYDADSDNIHIGDIASPPKAGWQYNTVCNMYETTNDYDKINTELLNNAKANAKFIVKACNAHEELLEALKWALKLVPISGWKPEYEKQFTKEYNAVIALIHKAEGK